MRTHPFSSSIEVEDRTEEPPPEEPRAAEVVAPEQVRAEAEEALIDKTVWRAERRLEQRQLDLLLDLYEREIFTFDDLLTMIRLGTITDEPDFLPCKDGHRSSNAGDWDVRYGRYHQSGRSMTPRERADEELEPARYNCPIMSRVSAAEDPLPCIEARRGQCQYHFEHSRDPEAQARLLHPDDPVVELELRPCLVLARELLHAIMLPGVRRQLEAEARQKQPAGEPDA